MPSHSIQQTFALACQHHQAGRLPEAEKLYQRVLAQLPDNIDVLRNLGALAHQMGRDQASAQLIQRVIAKSPNLAEAHNGLGTALKGLGQLDPAIAAFRQAIALKPAFTEAHNNLGIALASKMQFDQAIAAFSQAIALRPDFTEAHINLGNALKAQGRLDQSIDAYRRAIALGPHNAQAYANLGFALQEKGDFDAAIIAYRRSLALKPANAAIHNALGNSLKHQGHLDQAINAYHQAIALKPDLREAHYNLGIALADSGKVDEAIAAYRHATLLSPDYADAHNNLANALASQGQLDPAITSFRQTLRLKPDHPQFHYNLGLALLLHGDLPEGWLEYEWRWKVPDLVSLFRGFPQPLWDGTDLAGRTLVLHTEQGFGDTLQFIRYLPMVVGRGGKVIVEVQPPLIRLLQQLPGPQQWIPRGEPLPAFDVQCPLLTLPLLFGTTLQNIPAQSPPLQADPLLAQAWKRRLAQTPPSPVSPPLKIGLVWAGSPNHANDRNRSIPLSLFAPLAIVPGTQFFSLQKGSAAAQAANPPQGMQLIDHTEALDDFADTAAMIFHLDLIITVDTAVAHLAGAMGKPVWLLVPFVADWRWLNARQDSPWYPSMRLFRQTSAGNWHEVISLVVDALADLRGKPLCGKTDAVTEIA